VLVRVPVVHIRVVRMTVRNRLMTMPMCVRFARGIPWLMIVLMVQIVVVQVLVILRRMPVLVLMQFGEVQP
jgi:hypothetical protein